jgi:putative Mg2+ transporter-C (MgtC) family protein
MSAWTEITNAVSQEFSDIPDLGAATRIVVRLVVAAMLGGVLGYEREARGKSAGVRTHMLVALGAALFVLAPLEGGADDGAMSRVIQGLVAGIGFLGAGAIVKGNPGEEIQGLTTAATIWMTAALGMAVALGHETAAILAAVLALVVLRALPGCGHGGKNGQSNNGGGSYPPKNKP